MKINPSLKFVLLLAVISFSCTDDETLEERDSERHIPINISVASEVHETDAVPDGEGHLYRGETLVHSYTIHSGLNTLRLPDELEKGYHLKIFNDGYEPFIITIDAGTISRLAGKVLQVNLKKMIELEITTYADDDLYLIELEGTGTITIVWPDSSVETATMPLSVSKEFDTSSGRKIHLKGDLEKISGFRAFGYNSAITKLSGLRHLRSMETFMPGNLWLTTKLDLSHQKKLRNVDLFNSQLPHWLTLPNQHYIGTFTLSLADRSVTTSEIDVLINNIYQNSIRREIRNGIIHLTDSEPPSANATSKIERLEADLGWDIELNL